MKKSGTTTVFVVACGVVLCAAYAIGLCIREIRFRLAAAEVVKTEVQKTDVAKIQEPAPPATEQPAGPGRNRDSENDFGGPGFGGQGGSGFGDGGPGRFENMTEEERAQMRERFANGGGRGGMGMPQMSEEDMQKFRSEMENLRSKREEMSDEEYQQAMTQLREKYGMPSRGFGGRGRRGGDRSNSGQQENTMN